MLTDRSHNSQAFQAIWEVGGGDMLVEDLAYAGHEQVHVVVGLVDVVEDVVTCSDVVYQIFHEGNDIPHVGHHFLFFTLLTIMNLPRGYLLE